MKSIIFRGIGERSFGTESGGGGNGRIRVAENEEILWGSKQRGEVPI